jgi:flagella basal body P-ring formation protein FlgA
MHARAALIAFAVALSSSGAFAQGTPLDALRTAITDAVIDRLGVQADVLVELVHTPSLIGTAITAAPVAGARLGQPVRFTVTSDGGRPVNAVARISVTAPHVIARHALPADAPITDADVELRNAAIDGVLLQPLPSLEEVLAARTRRAIAEGEVLTRTALVRPFAVRAGDTVTMTVRTGVIEVRGIGRAVSSGYVGDVIRVLPPSSRQPSRARVVAPAAVEILR